MGMKKKSKVKTKSKDDVEEENDPEDFPEDEQPEGKEPQEQTEEELKRKLDVVQKELDDARERKTKRPEMAPTQKQIIEKPSRIEVADMIEGHLLRSAELLRLIRSMP